MSARDLVEASSFQAGLRNHVELFGSTERGSFAGRARTLLPATRRHRIRHEPLRTYEPESFQLRDRCARRPNAYLLHGGRNSPSKRREVGGSSIVYARDDE